ncbi:MAG: type II toxin-antitoxin system VapC family toxin [Terracidiphilus sp.]|jgi:predicted nucleic acid-binding protein
MYLLDTNVISELRKSKPHGAVVAWLRSVGSNDLFVSAVVIGEMQAGVKRTRLQAPEKAAEIERFIDMVLSSYAVLPLDAIAFREWARLIHGKSRDLTEDAMIAATARIHSLVVVTRNVKDFASFGVRVFDPFSSK